MSFVFWNGLESEAVLRIWTRTATVVLATTPAPISCDALDDVTNWGVTGRERPDATSEWLRQPQRRDLSAFLLDSLDNFTGIYTHLDKLAGPPFLSTLDYHCSKTDSSPPSSGNYPFLLPPPPLPPDISSHIYLKTSIICNILAIIWGKLMRENIQLGKDNKITRWHFLVFRIHPLEMSETSVAVQNFQESIFSKTFLKENLTMQILESFTGDDNCVFSFNHPKKHWIKVITSTTLNTPHLHLNNETPPPKKRQSW